MPKPTLFSIGINGVQRSLFTIQERASGDLTIIIKHSKFAPAEEGGRSNENDAIVEQRCSVHRTPKNDQINVIKSTMILKDSRAFYTRNYSKAIKSEGQFAGIFIRRAGDLSDPRYIIKAGVNSISLGEYDPTHFQPTFMVIVGARNREFEMLPEFEVLNAIQHPVEHFRIIVLWQFLAFNGQTTTRSLTFKNFSDEEIAAAPVDQQANMRDADKGFTEWKAIRGILRAKAPTRERPTGCHLEPSNRSRKSTIRAVIRENEKD